MKTKWVKVCLRKIETIPGGIEASPTPDFVGSMPKTIWSPPKDEYEVVMSVSYFRRLIFKILLIECLAERDPFRDPYPGRNTSVNSVGETSRCTI